MKRLWFIAAAFAVAALVLTVPAPLTVADETTVVVSRPGTVFHRPGSDDVRGRGYTKTLEGALAAGYTPCNACFASVTSAGSLSVPASGAGGAVVGEGGPGYGIPPKSVQSPTQPFGLKQLSTHRGRSDRGLVRNPYVLPETVRNPGAEQGAYASVD